MPAPNYSGAMIALSVPDPENYALYPPTEDAVPADDLHLTLAYLGESDEITQEDRDLILDACQTLADTSTAPEALFPALSGVFPPDPEAAGNNITVPYYAAPMPTDPFDSIREELLIHLSSRGVGHFVSAKHPVFHPHVTLTYAPLDDAPDLSYLPTPVPVSFGTLIAKFGDEIHEFHLATPEDLGPELPITASVRAQLHKISVRTQKSEDYLLSLYLNQRAVTATPAQSRAQAALERTAFLADPHHKYEHHTRIHSLLERAALEPDPVTQNYMRNRALAIAGRTRTNSVQESRELDALTASLHSLVADGNSSIARSLRARKQLRDRYGRWIEMGGGVRFKKKATATSPAEWVHGIAEDVDVANGRVIVKKDDGTKVSVPASKIEQPKAILGLKKAANKVRSFIPRSQGRKGQSTTPKDFDPEKASANDSLDAEAVAAMERIHEAAQTANPGAKISGGNIAPLVNDINLKAAESDPAQTGDTITFIPSKNPLKDNDLTLAKSDVDAVRSSIDRITLDNLPPQEELDAMEDAERTSAINKARAVAYSTMATKFNERGADPALARMPSVRDEDIQPVESAEAEPTPEDVPDRAELVEGVNDAYQQLASLVSDESNLSKDRDQIKKILDTANDRFLEGTDSLDTYLGHLDRLKEYANAKDPGYGKVSEEQKAFSAFAEDIDNVHQAADGEDLVGNAMSAVSGVENAVEEASSGERGDWTEELQALNSEARAIHDRVNDGTYLENPDQLAADLRGLANSADKTLTDADQDPEIVEEVRANLSDAAEKLESAVSTSSNAPETPDESAPEAPEAPEEPETAPEVEDSEEPTDLPSSSDDAEAYFETPEEWEDVNNAYIDVLNLLTDILADTSTESGLREAKTDDEQTALDNFHAALSDWDATSWDAMTPEKAKELVDAIQVAGSDLSDELRKDPDVLEDDLNTFDGTLTELKGEVDATIAQLAPSEAPSTPAAPAKGAAPSLQTFQDLHDRIKDIHDELPASDSLRSPLAAAANQLANIGKGLQTGDMDPDEAAQALHNLNLDLNNLFAEESDKLEGTPTGDALDDVMVDAQQAQNHLANGNFDSGTPETPEPEAPAEEPAPEPADELIQDIPDEAQDAFMEWVASAGDFISQSPDEVDPPEQAIADWDKFTAESQSFIAQYEAGLITPEDLHRELLNVASDWNNSEGRALFQSENGELDEILDPTQHIEDLVSSIPGYSPEEDVVEAPSSRYDPWAFLQSEEKKEKFNDWAAVEIPEPKTPKARKARDTKAALALHGLDAFGPQKVDKKNHKLPDSAPEGSEVVGVYPLPEGANQTINGSSVSPEVLVRHPDGSLHVYSKNWSVFAGTSEKSRPHTEADGLPPGIEEPDTPVDKLLNAIDAAYQHADSVDALIESDDPDDQAIGEVEKEALDPVIEALEEAEAVVPILYDFNTDPDLQRAVIEQLQAKDSGIATFLAKYLQDKLDNEQYLTDDDYAAIKDLIDLTSLAPDVTPDEKANYELVKDDLNLPGWKDSPLVEAIKQGGDIKIDEVDTAAPVKKDLAEYSKEVWDWLQGKATPSTYGELLDNADAVNDYIDNEYPYAEASPEEMATEIIADKLAITAPDFDPLDDLPETGPDELYEWEKELLGLPLSTPETTAPAPLNRKDAKEAWKKALADYLDNTSVTPPPGGKMVSGGVWSKLSPEQYDNLSDIASKLKGKAQSDLDKAISDHTAGDISDDELIQAVASLLSDPTVTNSKLRGRIRSAAQGLQTNKPSLVPILRPKFYGDPASLSEEDLHLPSPEVVKGTLGGILKQHNDGTDLAGLDPDNSEQDSAVRDLILQAEQRVKDAHEALANNDFEALLASMNDAQNLYDSAINTWFKVHKNDKLIRRLRARRRALNEIYAPFEGKWPDPVNGGNKTKFFGKADSSGKYYGLDSEGNHFYPGDEVERLSVGHGVQGNIVYVEAVRGLNGEADFRAKLPSKKMTQMISGKGVVLAAVGPNNPLYYDPDYTGPKVDDDKHPEGMQISPVVDGKMPVNTMAPPIHPTEDPIESAGVPTTPETSEPKSYGGITEGEFYWFFDQDGMHILGKVMDLDGTDGEYPTAWMSNDETGELTPILTSWLRANGNTSPEDLDKAAATKAPESAPEKTAPTIKVSDEYQAAVDSYITPLNNAETMEDVDDVAAAIIQSGTDKLGIKGYNKLMLEAQKKHNELGGTNANFQEYLKLRNEIKETKSLQETFDLDDKFSNLRTAGGISSKEMASLQKQLDAHDWEQAASDAKVQALKDKLSTPDAAPAPEPTPAVTTYEDYVNKISFATTVEELDALIDEAFAKSKTGELFTQQLGVLLAKYQDRKAELEAPPETAKSGLYNNWLGEINHPSTTLAELADMRDKIKADAKSGDLHPTERNDLLNAIQNRHNEIAGSSSSQYYNYATLVDDINGSSDLEELGIYEEQADDAYESDLLTEPQYNSLKGLFAQKEEELGGEEGPDGGDGGGPTPPESPSGPTSSGSLSVGDTVEFYRDGDLVPGTIISFDTSQEGNHFATIRDEEGNTYDRTVSWLEEQKAAKTASPAPAVGTGEFTVLPKEQRGEDGDMWVKVDGKNKWGRYGASGVAIVAKDENGVDRVLLGKRGDRDEWYLPGGAKDENETPIQGATREFMEEAVEGGDIAPQLSLVKESEYNAGTIDGTDGEEWKYTTVVASLPSVTPVTVPEDADPFELGEYKWVSAEELDLLDDQGSLHPSMSNGNFAKLIGFQEGEVKPMHEATPEPPDLANPTYNISGWKKVEDSTGSQKGGVYQAPDGTKYFVKEAHSSDHAANEIVASHFYSRLGLSTVAARLGKKTGGSKSYIVTPFIEGDPKGLSKAVQSNDQEFIKKVQDGFAIDAWLGNYDVIGPGYSNIIADADGNPVRVDQGAAMMYRGTGGVKSWWSNDPTDIDEMRIGSNKSGTYSTATSIFGPMSDAEVAESARKLFDITAKEIESIVDGTGLDSSMKNILANTLIKRRHAILERFDLLNDPNNKSAHTTDASLSKMSDAEALVKKDHPGTPIFVPGQKIKVKGSDDTGVVKSVLPDSLVKIKQDGSADGFATYVMAHDIELADETDTAVEGGAIHLFSKDGHNYTVGETVYMHDVTGEEWIEGVLLDEGITNSGGAHPTVMMQPTNGDTQWAAEINDIITADAYAKLPPTSAYAPDTSTPDETAVPSLGAGFETPPAGSKALKKRVTGWGTEYVLVRHPDGVLMMYSNKGDVQDILGKGSDSYKAEKGWVNYEVDFSATADTTPKELDLGPEYAKPPAGSKDLFIHNDGTTHIVEHPNGSLHAYWNNADHQPSGMPKPFYEKSNNWNAAPEQTETENTGPTLPEGYPQPPAGSKILYTVQPNMSESDEGYPDYTVQEPDGTVYNYNNNTSDDATNKIELGDHIQNDPSSLDDNEYYTPYVEPSPASSATSGTMSLPATHTQPPAGSTVHYYHPNESGEAAYVVEHPDGTLHMYRPIGSLNTIPGKKGINPISSVVSNVDHFGTTDGFIKVDKKTAPGAPELNSVLPEGHGGPTPPPGSKALYQTTGPGKAYVVQHPDGKLWNYGGSDASTWEYSEDNQDPDEFALNSLYEPFDATAAGTAPAPTTPEPAPTPDIDPDAPLSANGLPVEKGDTVKIIKFAKKGKPTTGKVVSINKDGVARILLLDDDGNPVKDAIGKPMVSLASVKNINKLDPTQVTATSLKQEGIPNGLIFTKPDKDNPLYGTDAPAKPEHPGTPPATGVSEEWISKANEAYKARKLKKYPDQTPGEVQASSIWESRYKKVMQGSTSDLQWLLDNDYIDQAMFDDAKKQIEVQLYAHGQKMAAWQDKQDKYLGELAAWKAAQGTAAVVPLSPDDPSVQKWTHSQAWTAMQDQFSEHKNIPSNAPEASAGANSQKSGGWQEHLRSISQLIGLKRDDIANQPGIDEYSMKTWDNLKEGLDKVEPVKNPFKAIMTRRFWQFSKPDGTPFSHGDDISSMKGTIQKDFGAMEFTPGDWDSGGKPGYAGSNYDIVVDLVVPEGIKGIWTGGGNWGFGGKSGEMGFIAESGLAMYIWDTEVISEHRSATTGHGHHFTRKVTASLIPPELYPYMEYFEGNPDSHSVILPEEAKKILEQYKPNALTEGQTYTSLYDEDGKFIGGEE